MSSITEREVRERGREGFKNHIKSRKKKRPRREIEVGKEVEDNVKKNIEVFNDV